MLLTFRNVLLDLANKNRIYEVVSSSMHIMNRPNLVNSSTNFLQPIKSILVPSSGFKVVGIVKKRCKDCYLVRREERLYVHCKSHPRHKQMSLAKKPKNTWILTHATQSKVRPW